MNEVSNIEPGSALVNAESNDPVSFIAKLALDERIDEQKLRVLWDIQKDVLAEKRKEQAEAARLAYGDAMAKAQKEFPIVTKKAQGARGKYAKFEDIWEECCPVWTSHGFSISFPSVTTSEGNVRMTARIRHEAGHTEDIPAPDAPPDTAGKTGVQANQSTISYLKRGLTCSGFGIVTADEDDDGNSGAPQPSHNRDSRRQSSGPLREYVRSDEFKQPQTQPSQAQRELQAAVLRGKAKSSPPTEETWIASVERRIAEAPTGPEKIEVIGAIAAQEIKTEDDLTAMARSASIKKLAETKDNLTRIQVFLAAARQRISKPKVLPLTGQFDIYDIDGHHIDGPFLHPIEFAERFTEFMGTVPVEDWTATLKVNEVALAKAKKDGMAAKTLAKLESKE